MTAPLRVLVATVTAALVALTGGSLLLVAAPPASAADPCVGVIVDGRRHGGGLGYRCAQGDPTSGLDALHRAGYSYAFVPRQPGLVCQVNAQPACSQTSTTTYWSYWYRAPGSSTWVYSSQGAGSHDPVPGSTEAWVWQDGGRVPPPSIAQSTICPPPAAPAPTAGSGSGSSGSGSGSTGSGSSSSGSGSPGGGSAGSGWAGTSSGSTSGSTAAGSGTSATRTAPGVPVSPRAQAAAPKASQLVAARREAARRKASAARASAAASPTSPEPTAESGQRLDGAVAPTSGDGGPPWTGLVLGGLLVAGVGGAAAWRARAAQQSRRAAGGG